MKEESGAGECLWEHVPLGEPAPCDRYKHACCFYGRSVYVHGGRENSSLNDFWRYSIERNEWEQLKCTEEKLEGHSVVAYQGVLYMFGGMMDSAFTQGKCPLWMYEIDAAKWTLYQRQELETKCTSPENRKGHSAVVYGSSMYIYGGYLDLKGPSSEFLAFNFETKTWSLVSSGEHGPKRRHLHSAVVYSTAMYLFGGLNVKDEQNDFWKWNFDSNSWSSVRTSYGPPKTVGHSSIVCRDSMLIFGGSRPSCTPVNNLWKFQFNSQTWKKLAIPQDASHPSKVFHSLIGMGCSFQPEHKHSSLNHLNHRKAEQKETSSKQVPYKLGYFYSQRTNKVSAISDGNELEMKTFTQSLDLPVYSCTLQTCFEDSLTNEVQSILPTEKNLFSPFVEDKAICTAEIVEKDQGIQSQHISSLDMTVPICPDVLLLIGGKPLSNSRKITLWQMKPSNI
ncbi:ras guanine nucleotide exchange factor F-like isoform X2 [Rhinatrema bivittatum]|uniref:ras guanine nucleotide exchange factor F-like isoform X2 n=1 Tax=Rhinatrema bivittatum TaxID=194408 RepID=UPI001128E4BF|nr:ras guanine nucleotide exchange factor F-like isoform X2 [Rhinatrema bivittatum]